MTWFSNCVDGVDETDLESEVWQCAAQCYGQSLQDLIAHALKGYARLPGFDAMTRLHRAEVGAEAFTALRACLSCDRENDEPDQSFLWIRQHKREFIYYYALRALVDDELATGRMRDGYFSADLGL